MRVSQVVKDIHTSIREIVNALANRLHAEDNFAPDGTAGQVLTSNGPNIPPSWKDATGGGVGTQGPEGPAGPTGPTGPAGPAGPGTEPADDTQVWMPLSTVVAGVPELVWDGDDSLIPTLVPV